MMIRTRLFLALAAVILVTACYDETAQAPTASTVPVALSLVTRADGGTSDFSPGTAWESTLNISGNDYRVYFFTYDAATPSSNGTLVATLHPLMTSSAANSGEGKYYIMGDVSDGIISYADFRVLVAANWGGDYPEVTIGTTTIDDVINYGTYSASTFVGMNDNGSSSRYLPFYGIQEFSGKEWQANTTTDLTGSDINMLRAVAKIEVQRTGTQVGAFSSVVLHRYNSTGYCAPSGVYCRNDYFHDYTYATDFTSAVHLVGGKNDEEEKECAFTVSDDDADTWVLYIPEYSNMSSDYAYITVTYGVQDKTGDIFFGEYNDGKCTAYNDDTTTGRYNILRNNRYLFQVDSSTLPVGNFQGAGPQLSPRHDTDADDADDDDATIAVTLTRTTM